MLNIDHKAYAHVAQLRQDSRHIMKHTRIYNEFGEFVAMQYLKNRGYTPDQARDILNLPPVEGEKP